MMSWVQGHTLNGFRDSKEQTLNAASSGLELLKEVKVDAIIGPQKSAQANFLMDLGDKAKVPVISFSATSPSLRPRSPYFIQTGLSDDAQAGAIAAIVESFKCAPNSTFSIPLRIVSRLLQQEISCVQGLHLWRNSSSQINDELYKGYRKGNSEKKICLQIYQEAREGGST